MDFTDKLHTLDNIGLDNASIAMKKESLYYTTKMEKYNLMENISITSLSGNGEKCVC